MRAAEPADDDILAVAAKLADATPLSLVRVGGGRNSRVFRLDTDRGTYALKQYPSRIDDPRDRLGTETSALRWMEAKELDMVPKLVAADSELNFALLTWADGTLVREVGIEDVAQAIAFLKRLHDSRRTADIPASFLATEACLSGQEIERQIRARMSDLRGIADEPALATFIDDEVSPALDMRLAAARSSYEDAGISFEGELDEGLRSLVPSDFGFHNALRDGSGRLTFIDFEYFGWDDPVKLTADVMLHPGTPVSRDLRREFGLRACELYGSDHRFQMRLAALYPLFGLRWVLILLNEFQPERWRRRLLAGATDSWADAKARQLGAAREMLLGLEKEH